MKNELINGIINAVDDAEFLKKVTPRRITELDSLYEKLCTLGKENIERTLGDDFEELTDAACGIAGGLMIEKYYLGIAVGVYLCREVNAVLDNPFDIVKKYSDRMPPLAEQYGRFFDCIKENEQRAEGD